MNALLLLSLMPRGRVAEDKKRHKIRCLSAGFRALRLVPRKMYFHMCFILINYSRAIPCRRILRRQFRHESRAKTSRRIRLTERGALFNHLWWEAPILYWEGKYLRALN